MDISATVNGSALRIVDIDSNGNSVYLVCVDAGGHMFVIRKGFNGDFASSATSADALIATGVTIG